MKVLELSDEDFKEVSSKFSKKAIMNILKTNRALENLSKEIEDILKKSNENLELRNTIKVKIFTG